MEPTVTRICCNSAVRINVHVWPDMQSMKAAELSLMKSTSPDVNQGSRMNHLTHPSTKFVTHAFHHYCISRKCEGDDNHMYSMIAFEWYSEYTNNKSQHYSTLGI